MALVRNDFAPVSIPRLAAADTAVTPAKAATTAAADSFSRAAIPPPPKPPHPSNRYDALEQRADYAEALRLYDFDYYDTLHPKPQLRGTGDVAEIRYAKAMALWEQQKNDATRAAGPALIHRNEANAMKGKTGAALMLGFAQTGFPVRVLPDSEYRQKFPGTGGVTYDKAVYLPASAVADPNGVSPTMGHEFLHAILGEGITASSLDERIAQSRALMTRLGLDPGEGEQYARLTQGWPDGVAAQHVGTSFWGRDLERELQGLPPLPRATRAEFMRRTAVREGALGLLRHRAADASYSDEAFVADWSTLPVAGAFPLRGRDAHEQAANLTADLKTIEDGRWVEEVYAGIKVGVGTLGAAPVSPR